MLRVLRVSLAVAMLPALVTRAAGAEYTSPRGFSLQCPGGWIVASNDAGDANRDGWVSVFPFLQNVDANHTAAFFFKPRREGYAERISVDIIQGPPVRASSENMKAAVRHARLAIEAIGGAEANAAFELKQVADRATISIRHDVRYPGQEELLRQWQVLVPAKGRTLIVTCTARAAEFGAAEPIFAEVMDSLRVPDRPGNLLSDMPALTKAVVLGALVVCAVILLRILRAFRRKAPDATRSGPSQVPEDAPPRPGSLK